MTPVKALRPCDLKKNLQRAILLLYGLHFPFLLSFMRSLFLVLLVRLLSLLLL